MATPSYGYCRVRLHATGEKVMEDQPVDSELHPVGPQRVPESCKLASTAGPDETADLESRLADALAMIRDLRAENELLRSLMHPPQLEVTPPQAGHVTTLSSAGGVDAHSSEPAKIALFRSLVQGRTDVYAYRWEGRDGRSGYSPALRPGGPPPKRPATRSRDASSTR